MVTKLPAIRKAKRPATRASDPKLKSMDRALRHQRAASLNIQETLDIHKLERLCKWLERGQQMRDEAIVFLFANGVRVQDLATVTKLSRPRIYQILGKSNIVTARNPAREAER